ncbi:MAG: hypothetical protein AAGK02_07230 [Pseudomonadota bacterium]
MELIPAEELTRLKAREVAHRKRARDKGLPVEPVNVEALLMLQNGKCRKTGKPLIFSASDTDRDAGKPIIAHEFPLGAKRSPGHVVGNVWLWRNDANQAEARIETSDIAHGKRVRGETCRPKQSIPSRPNPWPPKGSRKLPSRRMSR